MNILPLTLILAACAGVLIFIGFGLVVWLLVKKKYALAIVIFLVFAGLILLGGGYYLLQGNQNANIFPPYPSIGYTQQTSSDIGNLGDDEARIRYILADA